MWWELRTEKREIHSTSCVNSTGDPILFIGKFDRLEKDPDQFF
jgi:hypothetical protein